MTLTEFKKIRPSMEFRPCFENKETLRDKSAQGIVFMEKALVPKYKAAKPDTLWVECSYDDDGNKVFNITDIAPVC
jgi:hypothetical protein